MTSEIIQVVPPISQAVIDPASGLPTKAMADFMHRVSALVSSPDPDTAEKIQNLIDRFDGTDESLKTLTEGMLALAVELQATVMEFQQTVQDDTESLARKIQTVNAALGANAAAILNVQQSRVIDAEARALDLGAMTTRFNNNIASVLQLTTALSTADEALAQQITTLEATVNEDVAAAITAEAQARSTADEAIASSVTTLETSFTGYRTSTDNTLAANTEDIVTNTAAITAEATARASADSALSSSVNTLSTTVSGHTTTLTEFAATINGITGTWGVQVDVNGNVTGLQLIGTETTSQFIINADVIINGSLTTQKIAANAVTVSVHSFSYGLADVGTMNIVQTATITVDQPCSISVIASVMPAESSSAGTNSNYGAYRFYIYRDAIELYGTFVGGIVYGGGGFPMNMAIIDEVSAGTYTYYIKVSVPGGSYYRVTRVKDRSILLLAAKR